MELGGNTTMNDSSTTYVYHSGLPAVSTGTPSPKDLSKVTMSTIDPHGAMVFVIATVCIYGLSIVFFIAGHIQKRQMNRDEEKQISHYLKRLHRNEGFNEDRKFRVLRFKSHLLADSALGQRHNRRISLMCHPRPPGFLMKEGGDSDTDDDNDVREATARGGGDSWRLYSVFGEHHSAARKLTDDAKSGALAPARGRRQGTVRFGHDLQAAAGKSDDSGADTGPQACLTSLRPSPGLPALPFPSLITEDGHKLLVRSSLLRPSQDFPEEDEFDEEQAKSSFSYHSQDSTQKEEFEKQDKNSLSTRSQDFTEECMFDKQDRDSLLTRSQDSTEEGEFEKEDRTSLSTRSQDFLEEHEFYKQDTNLLSTRSQDFPEEHEFGEPDKNLLSSGPQDFPEEDEFEEQDRSALLNRCQDSTENDE